MRLLALLLVMGCSGSDEGESCDMAHRDGAYVQSFTERSGGTCGALGDQVVRLDSASDLPAGCARDAADDVSSDQCKLERSATCRLDDGGTVQVVGITTEHDGGARITGISTMTIRDAAGDFVCSSTYDTEAVRQ